ncbi:MAG: hypothetical protein QHH10_01365 [Peptococcaceae bacterium]|jgi:hypothetical protein|nr:hypothetical protein [Peptococcaceae bacterium]MDH7523945.1 hypothetical protein [Peptococcaceae bacterium]
MSEEERRKYIEQSRQERNSMWAELVNKGITTQSVVDKIMELMPKRDDSKKPQPPADNNGPATIKVYINGAEKVFSPAPININGSVLVPMFSADLQLFII